MAQFHFVEDYVSYVRELMRNHPLDEAMSLAVGGNYNEIGEIEGDIICWAGLQSKDSILDFGCGSGRLALALSRRLDVNYTGFDVVQELLDYAKNRAPGHYQFALNRQLRLPVNNSYFDVVSCFSVFTHLLHSESYIYMEEMFRCLKTGGKLVMSFLEFAMSSHWPVFSTTVDQQRHSVTPHLNQFIERNQVNIWAEKIGYTDVVFVDGVDAPWSSRRPLGQSLAVLTK